MKIAKNLLVFVFAVSMVFSYALTAKALDPFGGQQENVGVALQLGNEGPQVMAAKVINWALGFLGIIAVVIILMGGFKWMTAGGNEDKVGEAKKLMAAGLIGLIIILAAWGVATYVVSSLVNQTA